MRPRNICRSLSQSSSDVPFEIPALSFVTACRSDMGGGLYNRFQVVIDGLVGHLTWVSGFQPGFLSSDPF